MRGIVSIDVSLSTIWQSWYLFRRGKKICRELDLFQYNLEGNLTTLHNELISGLYCHQPYRSFLISESKRRQITVACIKDRVVHRLIYEYLVKIYDKTFIYDAWSCRKGKGLIGAINRAQQFLHNYPKSFIWRSDITKFFDNVEHGELLNILTRKITDERTQKLLEEVIKSYETVPHKGIPIGSLTSQIFANIYLNELDRLVKHDMKPQAYLRYGDDFLIIHHNVEELDQMRQHIIRFITTELKLVLNPKNDILIKAKQGVYFLGVHITPKGRKLLHRNWRRIKQKLTLRNAASYHGFVVQNEPKKLKEIHWQILQKLDYA